MQPWQKIPFPSSSEEGGENEQNKVLLGKTGPPTYSPLNARPVWRNWDHVSPRSSIWRQSPHLTRPRLRKGELGSRPTSPRSWHTPPGQCIRGPCGEGSQLQPHRPAPNCLLVEGDERLATLGQLRGQAPKEPTVWSELWLRGSCGPAGFQIHREPVCLWTRVQSSGCGFGCEYSVPRKHFQGRVLDFCSFLRASP